MKRAMLVVLAAALSTPAAWADDAGRALVLARLGGMETGPTPADFKDVPGAAAELLAIAHDAGVPQSRRGNAIVALGWFPVDVHRFFLEALLADPMAESYLRRKAAFGLANGWRDAALPALVGALGSPDVQLRNTTINAIASVGSASAHGALRKHLASETDASVRDTLAHALK